MNIEYITSTIKDNPYLYEMIKSLSEDMAKDIEKYKRKHLKPTCDSLKHNKEYKVYKEIYNTGMRELILEHASQIINLYLIHNPQPATHQ